MTLSIAHRIQCNSSPRKFGGASLMVIVSETKQEIEYRTAEGQGVCVHNGQGADSGSYIRETIDTSASNHLAQASPFLLLSPPPPPYNPYPSPSNHLPLTNPTGTTYRQSPLSRFLKAFIPALLLYILILGGARRSVHMAFHSVSSNTWW